VLQQTVKLDSIQSPEYYDCIFVPGGHGPVYDLATSELLAGILTKAAAAGGDTGNLRRVLWEHKEPGGRVLWAWA
jgi:putative intracellular protease/amidase